MKKKKMFKRNKNFNLDKRIKLLVVASFFSFIIILVRLFYLIINDGRYYEMILKNKTNSYIEVETAPRGRIYDRNGNLIVDNEAIRKIYYKKTGLSSEEEIKLAYDVSSVLSLDYDNLLERNLKEFFLVLNKDYCNNLITEKEYELYNSRKLSLNDLEELKLDRITKEDLDKFSKEDKKAAYLYYLMNKGYYSDEKDIKVNDVLEKEYVYILENMDRLKGFNTKLTWQRKYLYGDTLRNILGSVTSSKTGVPSENKEYYLNLGYSLDDRVGISGIEKEYDSVLKGEKAKYKVNSDNSLELVSAGKKGFDIVLGIDIVLQQEIENIISDEIIKTKYEPNTSFYNRSFVVIEEPKTGDVMAIAGKQLIDNEINDYSVGAIVSSVTPGSVVKGASILVGYNNGVIDIGTTLYDSCIKFLNMPAKCSWKTLGYVNDLDALKWSSNVYQFKIAMMVGGFDYSYNKELNLDLNAFNKYRSMFYQFGLGVLTGIDFPKEDYGVRGGSYAGDLLINYAIGQYDTYTPLQLSQYITTIANNGVRIKPRFLKKILDSDGNVLYEPKPTILNKVDVEDKYISRVQEGFKLCVSEGTGMFYMGDAIRPAGKTGTSESFVDNGNGIYNHPTISNNFVGYAPYDNPVMSIEVSSPDVQDLLSGEYKSDVNYRITKKATNAFFSFYDENGNKR